MSRISKTPATREDAQAMLESLSAGSHLHFTWQGSNTGRGQTGTQLGVLNAHFNDGGYLYCLTPVRAEYKKGYRFVNPSYADCTLLVRTDTDGLHAQCTLLDEHGVALSTFTVEDLS